MSRVQILKCDSCGREIGNQYNSQVVFTSMPTTLTMFTTSPSQGLYGGGAGAGGFVVGSDLCTDCMSRKSEGDLKRAAIYQQFRGQRYAQNPFGDAAPAPENTPPVREEPKPAKSTSGVVVRVVDLDND